MNKYWNVFFIFLKKSHNCLEMLDFRILKFITLLQKFITVSLDQPKIIYY